MENNNKISADLLLHTGVNVARCYQCGKCTAGCVLASEMSFPPSYLMRLLQTGTEKNYERVLQSKTIWMCVNCENCLGRCPMEIDIPKVMDYLREQSLSQKKAHSEAKPIIAFHRPFLDSIKYTGRLYEMGLIGAFKARTFRLTQDVALAPKMYMNGKLHLMPEMVNDRKGIKEIFSKTIDNPKTKNK